MGSVVLHMQETSHLEEEAADFAWDVAPLEPPAAVRVVASDTSGGGDEPPKHMRPLYENCLLYTSDAADE